jgi:hypothetical protein
MDPNYPLSHQINPNFNPSGIPSQPNLPNQFNQNNGPAPSNPQFIQPPSILPENNFRPPSNPLSNPPSASMYSNIDVDVAYPDVGPVPESSVHPEQSQTSDLATLEARLASLKK